MSEALKNYILIAKPGIVIGNLITAAAGFFFAAKGQVDIGILLPTLSGISLVVASGCVFNNCIDRNLDGKMVRTRNRVLVQGRISPTAAVVYALVLGAAGTSLLGTAANTLTVLIVLAGFAVYVGVYSLLLKRRSAYGTLIGSLAGTAPPVAGYCAVGGRFDLAALILLLIFGLWQMPHCYAIAVFRHDDYAAAALPVLPVKPGLTAVRKLIFGYILAFTAASLLPTFAGYTGYSYLAVAVGLGLAWLCLAWSGCKTCDDRLWAKTLFVFSILTVFILSAMMAIDCTPPAGAASKNLWTYVP